MVVLWFVLGAGRRGRVRRHRPPPLCAAPPTLRPTPTRPHAQSLHHPSSSKSRDREGNQGGQERAGGLLVWGRDRGQDGHRPLSGVRVQMASHGLGRVVTNTDVWKKQDETRRRLRDVGAHRRPTCTHISEREALFLIRFDLCADGGLFCATLGLTESENRFDPTTQQAARPHAFGHTESSLVVVVGKRAPKKSETTALAAASEESKDGSSQQQGQGSSRRINSSGGDDGVHKYQGELTGWLVGLALVGACVVCT